MEELRENATRRCYVKAEAEMVLKSLNDPAAEICEMWEMDLCDLSDNRPSYWAIRKEVGRKSQYLRNNGKFK